MPVQSFNAADISGLLYASPSAVGAVECRRKSSVLPAWLAEADLDWDGGADCDNEATAPPTPRSFFFLSLILRSFLDLLTLLVENHTTVTTATVRRMKPFSRVTSMYWRVCDDVDGLEDVEAPPSA